MANASLSGTAFGPCNAVTTFVCRALVMLLLLLLVLLHDEHHGVSLHVVSVQKSMAKFLG